MRKYGAELEETIGIRMFPGFIKPVHILVARQFIRDPKNGTPMP